MSSCPGHLSVLDFIFFRVVLGTPPPPTKRSALEKQFQIALKAKWALKKVTMGLSSRADMCEI